MESAVPVQWQYTAVGIRLHTQVADDREPLAAGLGDGALRSDEPLARPADDDDVRAHGGERLAGPQADAARASRDHRDAAIQPEPPELIHPVSLSPLGPSIQSVPGPRGGGPLWARRSTGRVERCGAP